MGVLIGTKSLSAAPAKQLLGSGASGAQTCAPVETLRLVPPRRAKRPMAPTMAVATCIYLVSPLTYHYVLIPA